MAANEHDAPEANAAGRKAPALEVRNVVKAFGSVMALRGASFAARPGEIVGVVGDNGAGKSTLMKVLSGAVIPDEGEILIDGERIRHNGPAEARRLGIQMIYQDLALFNNLDVAANLYFGRELTRGRIFLRKRAMRRNAAAILHDLLVNIPDAGVDVEWMSGGQRQMIACAKGMAFESRLLILDEPTAALGVREANSLLQSIEQFKGSHTILLVTQRIPDVLAIADRVLVMKDGRSQGELNVADVTLDDVVELIIKGRGDTSARPEDDTINYRSFG
jgi:ABC-type sugar transport system ATPase subunit